MIFKMRKGDTLQKSNADTHIPWDMMPVLAKMDWHEQFIVAFCCDTDRNPVKGMDDNRRAIAIAAYLDTDVVDSLTVPQVLVLMAEIKQEDTKMFNAANEYWGCQKKPMHIALSAIDKQITDISIQLERTQISISSEASDKMSDRAFSFMEKLIKFRDSRVAMLESIGGDYEIQFFELFSNSSVKKKGILESNRKK